MNSKTLHIICIALSLIVSIGALNGQSNKTKANRLFSKENYCEALFYYNQALEREENKKLFFRRGISNYECRNFDMAIKDIENSMILGNRKKDVNLYLARIYHDMQDFEKAIGHYKLYLKDIRKNKREKNKIIGIINNCKNGAIFKYKNPGHFIENWGPKLNSSFDDFMPKQCKAGTSDFYFSSDRIKSPGTYRVFREFRSQLESSYLLPPEEIPFSSLRKNIMIMDFSEQGEEMYFSIWEDPGKAKLHESQFDPDDINFYHDYEYSGGVSLSSVFSGLAFINDTTAIYPAKKSEGKGGFDLYVTGIRNGFWIKPVNLGFPVNSEYDEISPWMSPDGKTLFFSSNNTGAVGGFDVFVSYFDEQTKQWTVPQNLGMPINSSRDEIHFRVLPSGLAAVFSSNRRDMGFGGFDNYWLFFKDPVATTQEYSEELPFLMDKKIIYTGIRGVIKPKYDIYVHTEYIAETEKEMPDTNAIEMELIIDDQIPIGELHIPYIYFNEGVFSDNLRLSAFLDRLATFLKSNKTAEVEFVGNALSMENNLNDLVRSVQMARNLSDSMNQRGIEKSRLHVKGSGSNFPYARPGGSSRSQSIIMKANNRIDIYIHKIDKQNISIVKEPYFISASLKDPRHVLYESITKGLSYRLHIKSSNFLLREELQISYEDTAIEYDPVNEVYYYTLGIFKTFREAKDFSDLLRVKNIAGAIVVPYIDGLRINNEDILQYARTFSDLINYMAELR